MAALPAPNAIVSVGPPLFVSDPSIVAAPVWSPVPENPHWSRSSTL
jgi:hypothetical protein